MRIYLAGEVQVETDDGLLREADLPARQGRLAFAHLVLSREHPLPHDQLAESIWPDRLPAAWATALSAIISKLRVAMATAGLDRDRTLVSAFGCYQLRLPADAWVDLEVATSWLHEAEAKVAAGRAADAYGQALVAVTVLRRPFLPGNDGPWVETKRAALRSELVRALEVMVTCLESNDELPLAIRNAEELVALEPLRETGYRHLMRLHSARGDRGEALKVYELCRNRLVDELGVGPSPETEALQLALLKQA